MRGKVEFLLDFTRQFRITPAYAGKRCSLMLSRILMRDHPRVCGEKREIRQPPAALRGSPPRMRGTGLQVGSAHEKQGITPAYAGKSGAFFGRVAVQPDHPRVCGEKLSDCQRGILSVRITPAYAGKRLKRSRSTVSPVAIVPLFPSVCNKPVVSDGSPAVRDAPLFLPAENAVPASPAYNLRSL